VEIVKGILFTELMITTTLLLAMVMIAVIKTFIDYIKDIFKKRR